MNTTDRLVAAYKTVEDAAPSLMLGNDPTSGVSVIAHAAVNTLIKSAPIKAKALLASWAKVADDEVDRRAASKIQ